MEFKNIGDTISVAEYNALVYLLRKFKRLTTTLQLGSSDLTSDFGSYHFTPGFKSFGANWIITDDVTVTSNDVLKNCYYSFIFTVIDVNLSGDINRRVVTVDSESTGDEGTLEVTIPSDLIAENEVILTDFNVEVVFDEHEYYTPIPDVRLSLSVDKRFIGAGEVATVTGLLTDGAGNPMKNVSVSLSINGVLIREVTDSDGKIVYEYTGTGNTGRVLVSAMGVSVMFYDGTEGLMIANVSGDNIILDGVRGGVRINTVGDVIIDWGDGTTDIINNPTKAIKHTYTDGLFEHVIIFDGVITSFMCFYECSGLTSISIPSSVTSIGPGCFYECSGLTSISIPSSVTSIERGCFFNCSSLTSISIPSSVTSLGDNCFAGCTNLISYELEWVNNPIPYSSTKFKTNTNTLFYIPIGTKTAYINKGYPSNKLIERGYQLTVTGDKSIIQSSETSTITALLVNNEQPVSDETLSYTVKHGTTTIDSGTITTDSTGTATISYTGSGVGEVNITVEYGTLLQETFVLYDTFYYDDTSTDTTSNYFINTQSGTSISYENNKVKITCGTQNGRNMIELRTPKVPLADISGKKVRFEVDLSAVTRRMQCNIIQTINGASVTTNGEIITEDGTCYVEGDIDSTATLVRFQVIPVSSAQNDTYYLTNFKVYSA